jgi:hypothetical protein
VNNFILLHVSLSISHISKFSSWIRNDRNKSVKITETKICKAYLSQDGSKYLSAYQYICWQSSHTTIPPLTPTTKELLKCLSKWYHQTTYYGSNLFIYLFTVYLTMMSAICIIKDQMVRREWIGKDVEASNHGLFKILWCVCCSQYGMCWQPLLWQRINTQ